ncbi:hypothetical protein H6789_03000 [Candidatus Nomurabacteria bacterium]|nr:hypothetical protein [Candidatus Nomurabacteria bacterium]
MNRHDISTDPIADLVPPEFLNKAWYHFSVDDVFDSLIDVTKRDIPLFSHPFFALLKEVNDQYDIQVDLELFWSKEIDGVLYTLKDVRDLTSEIKEVGSWLRFAPHADSYMVPPFEQTSDEQKVVFDKIYNEIDRFAGKSLCGKWVRLHYYSEMYEMANYFQQKGVTALFSTDRPVGSHRMPKEVANQLLQFGFAQFEKMNFIRTQFRVEEMTNSRTTDEKMTALFTEGLEKYGYITFYSHEYEFARSEVREVFRRMFKILHKIGCVSIKQ